MAENIMQRISRIKEALAIQIDREFSIGKSNAYDFVNKNSIGKVISGQAVKNNIQCAKTFIEKNFDKIETELVNLGWIN